jgi:ribosomal protein S18 acetylase RimI-like enzyme
MRPGVFLSFFPPKGQPPVDLHASSGAPALDTQLQQYVRVVTARDRDVERVGPFQATFSPHTSSPFLSYAIPDDGAEPRPADVAALVDAYQRRDRLPRLEFLPKAAPAVQAALLAGGLVLEADLAVMTCGVDDVVEIAPTPGIAIAAPESDEDFRAMRQAQHAAFGAEADPDHDGEEVLRQRASLAAGSVLLLARDEATGAIVGGGVATVPGDGVTEIAGIGVLESHRRRGIAGAITAGLCRAAFANGVTTAFLTPGNDGAHRVYARAGFADSTTMVHMSMPA